MLLGVAGCHKESPPPTTAPAEETAAADGEWSRIVVHAPVDTPVQMTVSPSVAIVVGSANMSGPMPRPEPELVEAFPAHGKCRAQSMCSVGLGRRMHGLVFVFDPVVEVEFSLPPGGGLVARVEYADRGSVSAGLADLFDVSSALARACLTRGNDKETRRKRATGLEGKLREIAASDPRAPVATAAKLALVSDQCTNASENQEIARQLLDTLDPHAPELSLWTDALRRLGGISGEPERADALRTQIETSHPNPEVSARLLLLRLHDLPEDADPAQRERIKRALASPRFAKTASASVAKQLDRLRDAVALEPGDVLPSVELASLGDEPRDQVGEPARWKLLYFSGSWCKGCVDALPKVRRFAVDHPDLQLVYVLVDSEYDARDFLETHAPVPGDVFRADHGSLRPGVFRYVATPSFVLTDTDGKVLATSDETKFSELDELLAGLDAK